MDRMMLQSAFNEIDRIIESGFANRYERPYYGSLAWAPGSRAAEFDLGVVEREGQLLIREGLPGCDPRDVSVTAEGRTLRICVDRQSADVSAVAGSEPAPNESSACQFERHIHIGRTYDLDTISASLKNGLLTVSVDKAAMELARKIPIANS